MKKIDEDPGAALIVPLLLALALALAVGPTAAGAASGGLPGSASLPAPAQLR